MTITLTQVEENALSLLVNLTETPEDVLHRILRPIVEKAGESRLQALAEQYRALTPEKQFEAISVLKDWADGKIVAELKR